MRNKGERLKVKGERILLFLSIFIFQFSISSCNPEAPWVVDDVTIEMSAQNVSAGFIEYNFHPNKDAYYLISCMPANELVDPFNHSKQFMILALDSANTAYIQWRNGLLREGEFNIAPFASHCLQYGPITHFFTNLTPDTDYWVFAFVVNPETLKPVGKLFIETVRTTAESIMDVHFDYRVRGIWDYIYPLDPDDKINSKFNVFILPNLYGDIITDEAAQMQGGVGTAGSANIGGRYAMFEAIHGSAPRMVEDGIAEYANPASLCRAAVMLLRHMGAVEKAARLETVLDDAAKALDMPGDGTGNTASDFTEYVLANL